MNLRYKNSKIHLNPQPWKRGGGKEITESEKEGATELVDQGLDDCPSPSSYPPNLF